jgi:hypothetical protein
VRAFLIGAVFGGIVAALLAPRRGRETRELVRSAVDRWQEQVFIRLGQDSGTMRSEFDDIQIEVPGGRGEPLASADDPILTPEKPFATASEPFVATDPPYSTPNETTTEGREPPIGSDETGAAGKPAPDADRPAPDKPGR